MGKIYKKNDVNLKQQSGNENILKGSQFKNKSNAKENTVEPDKCKNGSCKIPKNGSCNNCSCKKCDSSGQIFSVAAYKKDITRIILSAVFLLTGFLINIENYGYVNIILFLASYLIAGSGYLIKAFENILKGKIFDENFLMALATLCAIILGEYSEAVAVILFYSVGEFFQELAVNRTRNSVSLMMNLRPDYANIIVGGVEKRIDPSKVNIGDTLIIKPGEKVPVDCIVLSGSAYMDTTSLTGESVPQKMKSGDMLYSGIIDTDGVLTARAEKLFTESAASKILRLVENSAEKKTKAENFITKFAKIYTPAVVAVAAAIAFIIPVFSGYADFSEWLYKALIFLIISCPCAVVISVPLGFFGGIGGSSRRGILFKGANYFDALAGVGIMVLDKTGTLTKGTFSVVKTVPEKGTDKQELIKTAAEAEKYSSHPIALSIKKYYKGDLENIEVKNHREISGKGITAEIGGETVFAGNKNLMDSQGIVCHEAEEFGTIVYVGSGKRFLGYIVISDEIKEEAYTLVKKLKAVKVNKIIMLTGDNKKTAEYVAKTLGIDEYYSNLLPIDKVNIIEKIKAKNPGVTVAFCGDGINDAPVLARVDVGIAMGAMGSDAAIESADVVLLKDKVDDIVTAIKAARRTRSIVLQNIIFSIAFKVIIMILSLLGLATLWMAIFADVGVSLLAVLNSTRALMVKKL